MRERVLSIAMGAGKQYQVSGSKFRMVSICRIFGNLLARGTGAPPYTGSCYGAVMRVSFLVMALLFFIPTGSAIDEGEIVEKIDELVNELFLHDAKQEFRSGRYESARKKYLLLAQRGSSSAQSWLGEMYEKGLGVERDYEQAFTWYQKAARQGHDGAQLRLARMYYYGLDVPQDYVLAYAWLHTAAAQGNEMGRQYRDGVAELMSPEQLREAQALAQTWVTRYRQSTN